MIGFHLGDFQLLSPIGEGAVGRVFRGLHRTGPAVAVKVMTSARARADRARRAFLHEARTLAGLDHPHVVRILDFGEVTAEDAAASGGLLSAESPYLVMEYARGGTLLPWCGALRWRSLKLAMLALLDALAHAHARGVIHRDLKPSNVLLSDVGDPSSSLRLADFGIAHLLGEEPSGERLVAGTPLYIAPEQRSDDPRAQGPWTDLYSLGRLALALAGYELTPTGYAGLAPRPYPAGFEAWVARLTQEDPRERFLAAAEAREGLLGLMDADEDAALPEPERFDDPPDTFMVTDMITELPGDHPMPAPQTPEPRGPRRIAPPPARRVLPTLPPDWRSAQGTTLRPRLRGLGLGLFALRRHAIVGRVQSRDHLWRSLREVASSGQPRFILLRGAPGIGKRELARWLSHRAQELSGLRTLHVRMQARLDDGEALAAAFRRALAADDLSKAATLAQARRAVGVRQDVSLETWQPLVQAMMPAGHGGPEMPSAERRAVLRRGLSVLSDGRPLLLLLDEARGAPNVLEFLSALLDSKDAPPVLVLAGDPSPELPLPRDLAALVQHRRGGSLYLPPLTMDEQASLLRDALGLEPRLAANLAERTEGNPLFAVEVVSDWVQRGQLTPGPLGHRLRPGVEPDFPDSPRNLWRARLDPLLKPYAQPVAHALELAAALGPAFEEEEWRAACARLQIDPPLRLLDDLVGAGLLRSDEEGGRWRFNHALLRDALRERASRAGRWQLWNRAIVNMLMPGFTDHNLSHHHAERVGRHLLAAGEPLAALPHLIRGLSRRIKVGDFATAEVLSQEVDLAMESLSASPSDSRWGLRRVLAAQLAKARGRREDAERGFQEALDLAVAHGWERVRVMALQGLGDLAWLKGETERATTCHREAVARAEALDDIGLCAASRQVLGALARRQGHRQQALEDYQRAAEQHRATGDRVGEAYALRGIGEVLRSQGKLEAARPWLERALGIFNDAGAQRGTADALNSLGELAKQEDRLADAARLYASARDRFRVIGSPMAIAPETNLALVLLAQDQAAEARQVLLDVLGSLERGEGPRIFKGNIHAYLLPCAAAVEDWSGFDRHATAARILLDESGEVEEDVARLTERAGELAADAGKLWHAQDAWRIALTQRRAMGDPAAIDRIEAKLAALRTG